MKKYNYFNFSKSSAFSLMEVAIVIIIVGVFIAAIFVSDNLITKSRLQMAVNLSKSSPINSVKDNVLWLETSLSSSLKDSESVDDASVTSWNDQNNSANKISVVAVGAGPVFSNTINRIHAVKFDAASSDRPSANNYLEIEDASFLNKTDYTIFILEKRQSNSSDNYFIGENLNGTANQSFALGYKNDSQVVHSQGLGMSYDSTVSFYADSKEKARLFTFVHSSSGGNKTYINGLLAAEDSTKTGHLTNISRLSIGKGYSGEIGEIAFFTRALNDKERWDIEDYMSLKWDRKNLRKSTPDGSCTTGIVKDSGCDAGYSCDAGYIGADCASCDEGNGYYLLSGTCQKGCSISIVGSSKTAVVGSDSFGCDQPGYSGFINYTCNDGVFATDNACVIGEMVENCAGGTIDTSSVSGSIIHKFTSSGSLSCPSARSAQVLAVGGGGGGGFDCGGGGGGGQVVSQTATINGSATITVGLGGSGGISSSDKGNIGASSVLQNGSTTITALGGNGARGRYSASGTTSGYTGGGGGYSGGGATALTPAGGGPAGGNGGSGGGGGGGAGGAGSSASVGNGGVGISNSLSGSSVCYGGGGGGCTYPSNSGGTATCGGGSGLYTGCTGVNGTDGLGGGGGGCGACGGGAKGGAGGSGVVVVRYSSGTFSCPSGYSLSGTSCVKSCDVSLAGVSSPSFVFAGSGSFSCGSGYSGSVPYTCNSSGLSTTGQCYQDCEVRGVTGISEGTLVSHGSTSISCNSGFAGTISYTCNNSVFNKTGGSCSPVDIDCSGGTITNLAGGFTVHAFTSSGTLTCTSSKTAQVLVVAGGGGGGGVIGGGGGAGGVVYNSSYSLAAASYNITVGAGGLGGYSYNSASQGGTKGSDSVFDVSGATLKITALGGGAGGHWGDATTSTPTSGGSGGGGGNQSTPGTGTSGQGNNGGGGNFDYAGGGGGAGSSGQSFTINVKSGDGGAGVNYSSIFGTSVGESGWFASGGGGGVRSGRGARGAASIGGGGDGTTTTALAESGLNNTGGGGGGAGFSASNTTTRFGGSGGSGVVLIRYISSTTGL
jgi:hypothetical protein